MITTPRLHLRPWQQEDFPVLYNLCSNEQVMEYFPATLNEEQTQAFLNRLITAQETHGYSYFAAEERSSGRVIGFIGLAYQTYEASFTPATDIGWRLLPEFWGKGYATEGAQACLNFAFKELELSEVVSVAVIQNKPSIRVMEKIGMAYVEHFNHPALTTYPKLKRCVLYRVSV